MAAADGRGSRLQLLRESRDFRLLWSGNTVSLTGDAVAGVALPLVAVSTLQASAFQVGVLTALAWVPQLLLGLVAGVWMDRVRRRPVMIAADVGRALVVAVVPVAAATGVLHLWLLYGVAVSAGSLSMFFRLGWSAYLPTVIGRDRLLSATSTLEASGTAVGVAGPGIGGVLVQVLTAPIALAADAASFIVSALTMSLIRTTEPAPQASASAGVWGQFLDGVRFVRQHATLRTLVVFFVLVSVVFSAQQALLLIFLARTVGLAPSVIGTLLALAAIGGVIGALVTPMVGRAIGTGRTFWIAATVTFPFGLLIPLTTAGAGVGWYLAGAGVVAAGIAATNVVALSFLLAVCPNELLGRVSAVATVTQAVGLVVGGLAGGALGTLLGVRMAMWTVMSCLVAVAGLVVASPLRRLRDLPTPPGSGMASPLGRGTTAEE